MYFILPRVLFRTFPSRACTITLLLHRRPLFNFASSGYLALCKEIVFVDKFAVRWIRSRGNGKENEHRTYESDTQSTEQNQDSASTDGPNKEKPKVDPDTRFAAILPFCALKSFCPYSLLLSRKGIDMASFLEKYLKVGEVRQIIFCPDYSKAVALLHEGAIIDGRKVHEPVVVVEYLQDAKAFWNDIRKEEESMGISVSDGVRLDVYQGMTTFRVIELMLGVLIIAWLGTQYGRLIRQRILANKQKKNGGSP